MVFATVRGGRAYGTITQAKHGGISGSAGDDHFSLGATRHRAIDLHSRFCTVGADFAQPFDSDFDSRTVRRGVSKFLSCHRHQVCR